MDYPYCQSHKVVKNGHRQGKQSYLCRECGRQFRDSPCPAGYSSDGYKVYPCLIDDCAHLVSKTAMTRVEGEN